MNARPSPQIFTLTGNLLAERTLTFAAWSPGRTQRATAESFQVGGKGINVSKMLTRLGAPNTALCFAGGAPGSECAAWLEARPGKFSSVRVFPATTPTRTGTVVRDGTHAETTFLAPDAPPDAAAIRACADFLDAQPAGQVLALCGSLPGWAHSDYDPLRATFTRWLTRGVLAADTYGAPLEWLLTRGTALIKINADEFRSTLGDAPDFAATLKSPVARWVVTDGPRSVWLRDADGTTARLTPPPVQEVSATGSGDVLFAALLHAWINRQFPLAEAVKFALPYAAANAAHPGIAEFPEPAAISE